MPPVWLCVGAWGSASLRTQESCSPWPPTSSCLGNCLPSVCGEKWTKEERVVRLDRRGWLSSTSFQNYLLQRGPEWAWDACGVTGEALSACNSCHMNRPGEEPGHWDLSKFPQVVLTCIRSSEKAPHPVKRVLLEGDELTASTTVIFPGNRRSEC